MKVLQIWKDNEGELTNDRIFIFVWTIPLK